jgi:hypothetical protein
MDPNMQFSTTDDERIKSLKIAMFTANGSPYLSICTECADVFEIVARVLSTLSPTGSDDHLHSLAAISSLAHPITRKWLKRCAADPDINNIHASSGTKRNGGAVMLTARKLERSLLKDVQMTLSFDGKTMPFLKGNVFALDFPRKARKARKHHSLLSCKVQKYAVLNSLSEQFARNLWPEGQGLFFVGVAGWSKQDEFLADQALRLKDEHEIDEKPSGGCSFSELTNYMADMITSNHYVLYPLAGYAFKQARQGNPGALFLSVGSWGQLTWSFLNPGKAPWTFLGMPDLLDTIRSPSIRQQIQDVNLSNTFMFVVNIANGNNPTESIIRTVEMDVSHPNLDLDLLKTGLLDNIGAFIDIDQDRICVSIASGFKIHVNEFNDLTRIAHTAGRACTYCGTLPLHKLKVCQGCKATYYCDRTCQRSDWKHNGDPWHSRWCDLIATAVADQYMQ